MRRIVDSITVWTSENREVHLLVEAEERDGRMFYTGCDNTCPSAILLRAELFRGSLDSEDMTLTNLTVNEIVANENLDRIFVDMIVDDRAAEGDEHRMYARCSPDMLNFYESLGWEIEARPVSDTDVYTMRYDLY